MYLNKTLTLLLIRLITPSEAISECPKCGRPNLRRSQVRFYERLRKALSSSRPYRCIDCRLRVWGRVRPQEPARVDADAAAVAAWTQAGVSETLDLSALDHL
jgi:DNA-directed RNA polymerase subunit RPC12/RpoP